MWTLSNDQISALFCTLNTGAEFGDNHPGIFDLLARGLVRPICSTHRRVYTLTPEGQTLAAEIVETDLIIHCHKNRRWGMNA